MFKKPRFVLFLILILTIAAIYLDLPKIKFKGVHAPEFIVPEIEFFKELKKRNIYVFLNNKKVI